jgi:hypothetical protein
VLTKALIRVGLRGWHFQVTSLASIYLCIALWIRAKTVDQEERGNAERRALFVGLWPPMFWLIGDAVQLEERSLRRGTVASIPLRRRGGSKAGVARGWRR